MIPDERVDAFARLGNSISGISPEVLTQLSSKALPDNPWFTPDNVALAFSGIAKLLVPESLRSWTSQYPISGTTSKTIGVIMAGNIPMVGFHDFLCVLVAGHKLKAKLSSQDHALTEYLAATLINIEPEFSEAIQFAERLHNIDALIATGSDNTARYFEYYFRDIPHIIRKNRTSCAVISGDESDDQLALLGRDIFSYFGLGCRNVSKIFVPPGFDLTKFFPTWESFRPVIGHNKYFNNYEYQKSIFLVNKTPFYDNGFILLKEDSEMVSPVSVLYFESYADRSDLTNKIEAQRQKIQCIVSAGGWFEDSEKFGEAQFPVVDDYSDKVDTMKFLTSL